MACACRAGLASIRRAFSTIHLRPQQWSCAAAEWPENLDFTALKAFQNGKSSLRFTELILSHTFYSTDASATVQIHEETRAALSEDENPESLNSKEEKSTLVELNKTDETSPKKIWKLVDAIRETCRAVAEGGENVEENLNHLGINLSPQFVTLILQKVDSPSLALRFFEWAKLQPGFKHNTQTYDTLVNILGLSKDFETLQRVLSERSALHCSISAEAFLFATVWHDDTDIFNEVMEMFEKLELSLRRDAYEMLIAALCQKNHVNAALRVLEKMVSVDCAPRMATYRPLIEVYCQKKQMDKVQEVFEIMKDSPQDFICYNLVLRALCNRKKIQIEEAAQFFERMIDMGCKPEAYTYGTMIQAMCKIGNIEGALRLFDRLKEEGVNPLPSTYWHLLDGLLQIRGFDEAHTFLIQQCGKDSKLDTSNYNYFISACRLSSKRKEAANLLVEKKVKGFGGS